jgi:hypothetical protein
VSETGGLADLIFGCWVIFNPSAQNNVMPSAAKNPTRARTLSIRSRGFFAALRVTTQNSNRPAIDFCRRSSHANGTSGGPALPLNSAALRAVCAKVCADAPALREKKFGMSVFARVRRM